MNMINTDHYKTRGRDRPNDHLQRLKRRRKIKGLSARQLWERKKSQRATKQLNRRPAVRQSVNGGAVVVAR
jgi:hypothetical protein